MAFTSLSGLSAFNKEYLIVEFPHFGMPKKLIFILWYVDILNFLFFFEVFTSWLSFGLAFVSVLDIFINPFTCFAASGSFRDADTGRAK